MKVQEFALEDADTPSSQGYDKEIGQIFVRARKERRLDLSEIAEYLHIRQVYLEAIEQGDLNILPGRIYTFGFMKKYAEFLKLDFQEIQRRLDSRQESYTTLAVQDIMQPYTAVGYKKYIWLSFALITVVGGMYTYTSFSRMPSPTDGTIEAPVIEEPVVEQQEPSTDVPAANPPTNVQNEIQPTQLETTPSPSPSIITIDKPIVETVVESVLKSPILVLHAVQPTWINIRDTAGQSLFRGILQKGESYTLPPQKGLVMTVGNAGGLEMTKDGVQLPSLGGSGQVRKELSVDQLFSLGN